MFVVRLIVLILSFLCSVYSAYLFNGVLPIPIKVDQIDPIKEEAKLSLEILKVPKSRIEELSTSVTTASKATGLSSSLLVAVIHDESGFNRRAVSPKNYKGLMQTPQATFVYSDVDVLHGARILKDKLAITKNDLLAAMTLYKGGNNPVARKHAIQTVQLYNRLKIQVEGRIEDGKISFES